MTAAKRAGALGPPGHALITGASSGLGAALARRYARSHWRLSLCGRDGARLADVASACRDLGSADVGLFQCDVRDADDLRRQALAADARSPVDVLIANAGLGGARAQAGENGESIEQATALVDVNLVGVLNTVTPLIAPMVSRGRGRVVLIGSVAGMLGLPMSPTYCATKAAVHVYGEALRRRLRATGVGVTVVCPGFVETPMSASLTAPRPFLWSSDRAAAHIVSAIARRRSLLIFPWQLHAAVIAARLMPGAAVNLVLSAAYAGAAR